MQEAVSKIKWTWQDPATDESTFEDRNISLDDLELGAPIAKGANAVVYEAQLKSDEKPDEEHYPLALKMLFNYDIQSNAMAIMSAMHNEIVPVRQNYDRIGSGDWNLP